jgi:serine/threonine-protein kinase ULK/ATG1
LLEDRIKANLEEMKRSEEDIELNMSMFYLKNNIVVDHPKEITQKENINNYAYEMLNNKGKTQQPFEGEIIKREIKRA